MIRSAGHLLGVLLLAAALAGCFDNELTVADAWIPAAPPHVSVLAGYMTIENGTDQVKTIVAIDGALFERIEVHRTIIESDSGLARMVRQDEVVLKPGERLDFDPGGYHLMLIKPERTLKEGENVPLTLLFTDRSSYPVEFRVRPREPLRP
jgi:hypothetical protein